MRIKKTKKKVEIGTHKRSYPKNKKGKRKPGKFTVKKFSRKKRPIGKKRILGKTYKFREVRDEYGHFLGLKPAKNKTVKRKKSA